MALADLTFKLYTDSALNIPFTGVLQLTHESDLSDGSQDTTLYFGSNISGRKLEANSNPGVDQITITPTDGLADWTASTLYSIGDIIEPTTPNGLKYTCSTAGTSGATEPTFPTSGIGSTVADGTAVWTLTGGRHEITEVKLALSSAGLNTATAGASLDLGSSITDGSGNAVAIYIRVTNAVTDVSNNTGQPEVTIDINQVIESGV